MKYLLTPSQVASRFLTLICVLSLTLFTCNSAYAQIITFTNIVDSSGVFSSFDLPVINALGRVAFRAFRDDGGEGVYTGNGGAITTITDSSSFMTNFATPLVLNNAGTVAFYANRDAGGSGIYKGNGGSLVTVADTDGFLSGFDFDNLDMNNSGTVAFFANRDDGGQGIYTGNSGSLTTVADTDGIFSSFASSLGLGFGYPILNDSGTVAFQATRDDAIQGLYTSSGGTITTIADTNGFLTGFDIANMNAAGTVAVVANDGPTILEGGIYTGNGGTVTTIADYTGFLRVFGYPVINDSETIAFWASLDAGGRGIFRSSEGILTPIVEAGGSVNTLSHPFLNNLGTITFFGRLDGASVRGVYAALLGESGLTKVLEVGDTLFGATVTAVPALYRDYLNDSNQLAFQYQLSDGRQGIARANIGVVGSAVAPEPGTLVLFMGGLVAGSRLIRRPLRSGIRPSADTASTMTV